MSAPLALSLFLALSGPAAAAGTSVALVLKPVSAQAAKDFQAGLSGVDLKAFNLPETLSVLKLDPLAARDRLVLAPLMASLEAAEGRPAEAAALLPQLVSAKAQEVLAQAAQARTTAELREARGKLSAVNQVAAAYGLADIKAKLDAGYAAAGERLEAETMRLAEETAKKLENERKAQEAAAAEAAPAVQGAETSGAQLTLAAYTGPGAAKPAPAVSKALPQAAPAQDKPNPLVRAGRWLKRAAKAVADYYRDDPPPPFVGPAADLYKKFVAENFYAKIAAPAREEIAKLRAMKDAKDREAYVRAVGDEVMSKIYAARGTANVGFHYNLHGGREEDFVRSGIRATMGDRISNRNENPWTFDARLKVFFFQAPGHSLYDILEEKYVVHGPFASRMGDVLAVFDLDHPDIVEGFASGKIGVHTRASWNMSYTFAGMPGVPYSSFLVPPLRVFDKTASRLGMEGKLSRVEDTLAAMRLLEAAVLSSERFVP